MFNIFKSKKVRYNLGWLGVDLHSHLIPGIDDGVERADTSVFFIQQLIDLGIIRFIMTPHVYDEVHPNTPESIHFAHLLLQKELTEQGLRDLSTYASAEYMMGDTFPALVESDNLIPFPGKYLLVEMPFMAEPLLLDQVLFLLSVKGYKPIMAHPERYVFYFNRPQAYHKLKEMGCLLQLNLLSPTGYYGKEVAKAAQYLIKNRLYDFAGTDLHHERHLEKLTKYAKSGQAFRDLGHLQLQNWELFGG